MAQSPMRLRRQIDSAADLQSVVRAMKAQAAAGIAQYEKSVAASAAYAAIVEQGLGAALRQARAIDTPRAPRAQAGQAIVFGSDQGLVGRFNETLAEFAAQSSARSAAGGVWVVGGRMHAALDASGVRSSGTLPVPSTVPAITDLVGDLLARVFGEQGGEDAALTLYYNRPVPGSGSMYEPVAERVLPLDAAWQRSLTDRPWPTRLPPEVIGALGDVLRSLVREHLFVSLFRACADSLASENASRLAAMDRADTNIDKLLVALQGRFHRLRQSGIDEQLSDVTAGFRALASGSAMPP